MRIILVEDDHIQSKSLIKFIPKEIIDAKITLYETEFQFRSQLAAIELNKPDLFILDVMLRWTNPSPNMQEAPDDVRKDGFYTAGFRCLDDIAKSQSLKNIPVILYTVLDTVDLEEKLKDLPKNVSYISKEKELNDLIEGINRVAYK